MASASSSSQAGSNSSGTASDFANFNARLQRALIGTTRLASQIPDASEMKYQRTLDRKLGKRVDVQAKRLLSLTSQLVDLAAASAAASSSSSVNAAVDKGKGRSSRARYSGAEEDEEDQPRLQDEDLIDAYQANVVDITDSLLERIDANLDEAKKLAARSARQAAISGGTSSSLLAAAAPGPSSGNLVVSANASRPFSTSASLEASPAQNGAKSATPSSSRLSSDMRYANHLAKPQLQFHDKLENSRDALFVPRLPSKPHGMTELSNEATLTKGPHTGMEGARHAHPYEEEIDAALSIPLEQLEDDKSDSQGADVDMEEDANDTRMKGRMDTKPFTYVDSAHLLRECLEKLKAAKAIAIDLEHHDYRSYRGITCLMQISTSTDDFLVDVLVPEVRASAHILNEAFAAPSIVKVLHGSDWDIIWLQRDLGLYVVNLFDTFHASKLLGRKTGHSLASLLLEYTEFVPDKRYQLADWRIRPLTDEMASYARADTHFLLHIYRRLLQHPAMTPEILQEVRRRSANTAKQVYQHAVYDSDNGLGPGGWRNAVERAGKAFIWGLDPISSSSDSNAPSSTWVSPQGATSIEVFRAVHDWVDRVAREEDESTRYILSNKAILALAEKPPADQAQLTQQLGHDMKGVVRERQAELLGIIHQAQERAASRLQKAREAAGSAPLPSLSSDPDARQALGAGSASSSDFSTSNSALFRLSTAVASGATSNMAPAVRSLTSSLFPAAGGAASNDRVLSASSAFAQVSARVHAAFGHLQSALHGGNGKVDTATNQPLGDSTNRTTSAPTEGVPVSAGSASNPDHVFVPRSERETTNLASVSVTGKRKNDAPEEAEEGTGSDDAGSDNEIVQVSQKSASSSKKKKKRSSDAPSSPASSRTVKQEPSSASKSKSVKAEPYDYSKERSILDQRPSHPNLEADDKGNGGKKKQKKDKGGTAPDADFKSAPKSMTQPKSGNRSHTFF